MKSESVTLIFSMRNPLIRAKRSSINYDVSAMHKSKMNDNSCLRKFGGVVSSKANLSPLSLYAQIILPEFVDDEVVDVNSPEEVTKQQIQCKCEWIAERC